VLPVAARVTIRVPSAVCRPTAGVVTP